MGVASRHRRLAGPGIQDPGQPLADDEGPPQRVLRAPSSIDLKLTRHSEGFCSVSRPPRCAGRCAAWPRASRPTTDARRRANRPPARPWRGRRRRTRPTLRSRRRPPWTNTMAPNPRGWRRGRRRRHAHLEGRPSRQFHLWAPQRQRAVFGSQRNEAEKPTLLLVARLAAGGARRQPVMVSCGLEVDAGVGLSPTTRSSRVAMRSTRTRSQMRVDVVPLMSASRARASASTESSTSM